MTGRSPAAAGFRTDIAAPHAVASERILHAVDSGASGLTEAEAARRLARYGPNTIPSAPPPSILAVFARQFASPLIYVLMLAAVLSAGLGEYGDAGFILAVLLVNAVIGTAQEHRAQRSADALRQMVTATAEVIRDGELVEVDATGLVVGDVVVLSSGNKVPAELRLLDSRGLRIDESPLTGESLPVNKDATAAVDAAAGVADRPTMAFAGTLVTVGRGRGVVTATGAQTEIGRLAGQLGGRSMAEPPLLTRMRRFTAVVGIAVAAAAVVLAAIELSRGAPWHEVLLLGVAMAVSAIPEGLPVALTVALAVAVTRMARRQVIVRRLMAVESLGSCTVIASDKTGTLTVNQLTTTVLAVPGCQPWEVTGVGDEPVGTLVMPDGEDEARLASAERLAFAVALCNEASLASHDGAWVHRGDAVDVALLVFAHKLGVTREQAVRARPLLDSIAFESERRYAATLHAVDDSSAEIVVKGAVEQLLPMCGDAATPNGPVPVDAPALLATAERLSASGQRLIAVASRQVRRDGGDELHASMLTGCTLLGFVGMIDPLRPDAAAAVASCRQAGIRVVMVTGDHPATARAIAAELGLATEDADVVTGAQLRTAETAGTTELDRLTARATVFARVEPAQKLAIVRSLSRQGEVVAVTGDGANDAPALHHAHVGVAMGHGGTDVAREAGELVVNDNRFSSIAAGVEEGRVAYANVRKVIQLLVTTGAGELVLILAAVAFALPLPLLAVQLLWLNLVTNGIQDVALAFEPAEGDEMRRRPRPPSEPLFNRIMVERVLVSAVVIGTATLTVYWLLLRAGWTVEAARNSVMLLMVLFENVQVFNTRSELRSVFRMDPRRNWLLLGGTVAAQVIHIVAMHLPATQSLLGLQPVTATHWLALIGVALTLVVAIEAHKAICRRRLTAPAG